MNLDLATIQTWAAEHPVGIALGLAVLVVGAVGDRLDKRIAKLDPKNHPILAALRDLFQGIGLPPSKVLLAMIQLAGLLLKVRVGVNDDDDPKSGPPRSPPPAPPPPAPPPDGPSPMGFSIAVLGFCLLTIVGTSGCKDPLAAAIRASNVAHTVGTEAAEVLAKTCTKPMESLAAQTVGADEAKRKEIAVKAADLASRCDPAVGVHESVRAAHRALRVVILAVEAGQKGDVEVTKALAKLALAAAELEQAIESLAGKKVP